MDANLLSKSEYVWSVVLFVSMCIIIYYYIAIFCVGGSYPLPQLRGREFN